MRWEHKNSNIFIVISTILFVFLLLVCALEYITLKNNSLYKEKNESISAELSNMRKTVYISTTSIEAGELLITDGEYANIEAIEIYTSESNEFYFDGEGVVYSACSIPSGCIILSSNTSDSYIVVDEDSSSVNVSLNYAITASYVDEDGNSLADNKTLTITPGATEDYFKNHAEDIGGYELQSISIGGRSVLTYGSYIIQNEIGTETVTYYTDSDGLTRYEINKDMDVVYLYKKKENVSSESETDEYESITETETDNEADLYAPITADSISG